MKIKLCLMCALVFVLLTLAAPDALACEPCTKDASMNFEATARAADLIIIAQRENFSPDELTYGVGGPENIKVKVIQTLKGETSAAEIVVKSWSGMCPYGIVLNDNKPHVIFLKKSDKIYRAVDMCSVKSYAVEDDAVLFEGQKISVEDFRQRLERLSLTSTLFSSPPFTVLYEVIKGGRDVVC